MNGHSIFIAFISGIIVLATWLVSATLAIVCKCLVFVYRHMSTHMFVCAFQILLYIRLCKQSVNDLAMFDLNFNPILAQ